MSYREKKVGWVTIRWHVHVINDKYRIYIVYLLNIILRLFYGLSLLKCLND